MIIHDKSRKQSTCVILGNLRKKISKHTTKTQSTKFLPILPTDTCPKVKADLPLGQFYYNDMKERLRIFSLFLTPFSTNLDEQTDKAPGVSTIILHIAINMPHGRERVRKLSKIIQVMLKTEPILPDSLWHNQCLPHYLRNAFLSQHKTAGRGQSPATASSYHQEAISNFRLMENRSCGGYQPSSIVNFTTLPSIWMYCSSFILQKESGFQQNYNYFPLPVLQ